MARRKETARIEPKFGGERRRLKVLRRRPAGGCRQGRGAAQGGCGSRAAGRRARARGGRRRPRRSLLEPHHPPLALLGPRALPLARHRRGAASSPTTPPSFPGASEWRVPERPPNIQILAVDGTLIGNRGDTGGESVRIEQLPDYVPNAVIAIEDRRFRSHFGVDPIGLVRAVAQQHLRRRRGAGRLDADPAARQEHVPDAGALAEAQGAGGGARGLAGERNTPRTRSWRCI